MDSSNKVDVENPKQKNEYNPNSINNNNNNNNTKKKLVMDGEMKRLIYAIILAIIVGYLVAVAMAWGNNRGLKHFDEKKYPQIPGLDDLGYDVANKIFNGYNLKDNANDYGLLALFLYSFIYVLIFCNNYRIKIFKRFLIIFSITFAIRSLIIISTIPPVGPKIERMINENTLSCITYNSVWFAPFEILGAASGGESSSYSSFSCYDYFLSGHTANATILALIVTKYSKHPIFSIIAWLLVGVIILFILYLELHYTIDCIYGVIIPTVFWVIMDYEVQQGKGWLGWWERKENIRDPVIDNDTFRQNQFPRSLSNDRIVNLRETALNIGLKTLDNNNNNNNKFNSYDENNAKINNESNVRYIHDDL